MSAAAVLGVCLALAAGVPAEAGGSGSPAQDSDASLPHGSVADPGRRLPARPGAANLTPVHRNDPGQVPEVANFVAVRQFTLAWVHSIEKTRWEEDYRVGQSRDGTPVLRLTASRIKGSGAGMEPPADAVWHDGWYVYKPDVQPVPPLRLTRSVYTADYQWCERGQCRSLGTLLPSDGGVTLLWPCVAQSG